MPRTVLIVDDHAGFRDEEPVVVLISGREAAEFGQRLARTSARGVIHRDDLSPAVLVSVAGASG